LGNYIGTAKGLQALDLQWNKLSGAGAVALVQGLWENACAIRGSLWRLDLAWNRLAVRCDESLSLPDCKCETCKWCSKVVATLANVFAEGSTLFHLDLSYVNFRASDCAVLAAGLSKNHSLFGLHFDGNSYVLDDCGFLVPKAVGQEGDAQKTTGNSNDIMRNFNECVRATPRRLMLDRLGNHTKSLSRDQTFAHTRVNPSGLL